MTLRDRHAGALAKAASHYLGIRFRLHGRDPATGLDCVGLLVRSLADVGCRPVSPQGYRLHNTDPARWLTYADQSGLVLAVGSIERGDVILLRPGPAQQHIVIAEGSGDVIHAHAGLGRIVRQPMKLAEQMLVHWRLG